MKQIKTVCSRDCYDTCSLIASVDAAGVITSVKGDPDHPITRGFLCPRGTKDPQRIVTNRIQTPSIRSDLSGLSGGFRSLPWNSAIDTLADRLQHTIDTCGRESVLFLDYVGNQGTLSADFPKRLWNALGVTQTDGALCSRSGRHGICLHHGKAYGIKPEALLTKDLILFWGFNAKVSAAHLWRLATQARKSRGAKIVVIDPRCSETAKRADLWIQPRPETDVALAYGLMNYLKVRKGADTTFLDNHTLGFEHLAREIEQWPDERTLKVTQVNRDDFESLGDLYSGTRNSAIMIGIGIQKCDQGADQARAVSLIPAMMGIHRGFYYSNSDAYSINSGLISGKAYLTDGGDETEQVAVAEEIRKGRFKFIYINCMNPAVTVPDQSAFRQGLARQDVFCVTHDTHWSDTAKLSDLVLPAPTFYEKEDVVIPYMHPYVIKSNPVIPPLFESKTEIEVMQLIARRLGLAQVWLYEDPMEVLSRAFVDSFENGTFDDLLSGRVLTLKSSSDDTYATLSGKLELYSSTARTRGYPPLPVQGSTRTDEYDFTLLNSAIPSFTSTQFQEVFGAIPAIVHINSEQAKSLGFEENQEVIMENDQGRARVMLTLSGDVPPDVLWTPRQSLDLDDSPMNTLMSPIPQPIGNGARYNSTRVRLKPN